MGVFRNYIVYIEYIIPVTSRLHMKRKVAVSASRNLTEFRLQH